jgi:hypothetical protein
MATKADEYRLRAQEADDKARIAADPATKRNWREVAEQWRSLAAQAQRNSW